MLDLSTEAARLPARASLMGILYAEDFDDPPPAPALPEPEPSPEPLPNLIQADVDAACAHAVALARLEWEASATRHRLDLLGAVRSSLAQARAAAEAIALAAAEATVATVLATLMGALPKLCAQHGPNEVRALLAHLLPMLRAEPTITIRVHPELAPLLREDLADFEAEFPGSLTIAAAAVAPGDVGIAWENGGFVRDTAQIHQVMHEALSQLGLLETPATETSPKRSLSYAE